MKIIAMAALALALSCSALAAGAWRAMTDAELKAAIPDRATVGKERIETELRTASGSVDDKGRMVEGVALITSGYSAEGKYSHFLRTQAPLTVGALSLAPGDYVVGYKRAGNDEVKLSIYSAADEKLVGTATAVRDKTPGGIHSIWIAPNAAGRLSLWIGRFAVELAPGE